MTDFDDFDDDDDDDDDEYKNTFRVVWLCRVASSRLVVVVVVVNVFCVNLWVEYPPWRRDDAF